MLTKKNRMPISVNCSTLVSREPNSESSTRTIKARSGNIYSTHTRKREDCINKRSRIAKVIRPETEVGDSREK